MTIPEPSSPARVYQITELTRRIKVRLEHEFGAVWLEGEISNLRRPSSGHYYFTLKDKTAQISAVLFKGNQRGLKVDLKDGVKVRAFGQITVYEQRGNYQIIIRAIEDVGKGALQEQFEQLKKKLAAEGLFDPNRKKKIPMLPRHVGIVTSPTGAAIRDILNIISRRFSNIHVLIAPVRVQGETAAREIAAGINWLNKRGGIDVIIVSRGGGSLEDLWGFNEERVARAIAQSALPVISAVGHEIDFTISDFVADLRVPTPSAAAELVVGCKEAFEEQLQRNQRRLQQAVEYNLLSMRKRLDRLQYSYVFKEPANAVRNLMQHIDQLQLRTLAALTDACANRHRRLERIKSSPVFHEPRNMLQQAQHRVDQARLSMHNSLLRSCDAQKSRLHLAKAQLNALSPFAVLTRGYAITYDENGQVIKSTKSVKLGEKITTRLSDGAIHSTIKNVSSC